MTASTDMLTFGPVPSRRLGKSLGINNIPPKVCSYSCIYCQLGRTNRMSEARQEFYEPDMLVKAVEGKVRKLEENGESIDYLSFVPDGEPTLDINLGKEIERLKELGIKIAVITNASLLWQQKVRNELLSADWLSLKIDSVNPDIWKMIDRPHGFLRLKWILESIKKFSRIFDGKLVTETMLVKDVNESEDELTRIADFISQLDVEKSYLSIPTRPPAENQVEPAEMKTMTMAYQIFRERCITVELLTGFEGTDFITTGDPKKDILAISSVHPMREDVVEELLKKAGARWGVVEDLVKEGKITKVNYRGNNFYLRDFKIDE